MRLEGWGGHPISGLPEIGLQVRKSAIADLRCFETGRFAAFRNMRPRKTRATKLSSA